MVRKTQEEDKKEILGRKIVWDITLMKAALGGHAELLGWAAGVKWQTGFVWGGVIQNSNL